jgi:hypothetical protein
MFIGVLKVATRGRGWKRLKSETIYADSDGLAGLNSKIFMTRANPLTQNLRGHKMIEFVVLVEDKRCAFHTENY